MKILFAASEAAPFVKTGGLGDVAMALPKALAAAGHEVKVILPYYGRIKNDPKFTKKMEFLGHTETALSWRRQYNGVFRFGGENENPSYHFIDNEYYFARGGSYALYGDYDDGEKFAFFSRAILDALPLMGFTPDLIHCNDWQTAALPLFLRAYYPQYDGVKTLYTIHNIEYQGKMPLQFRPDVLGLGEDGALEWDGCLNLMKAAIVKSDAVSTVSETYAKEILTDFFSHGLSPVLREHSFKLSGIVNGIDPDTNNPAKDKNLYENYSASSIQKKEHCKLALKEELGLIPDSSPLAAMVTRLVSHKGLDLVAGMIDRLVTECGAQLAVLGTGDPAFEEMLRQAAARHPGRICAVIGFDPALASRLYAGADLFLMPSLSEPCGLSQMIAMRYGCVPVVRETGGLKDTVPPYDPETKEGRGFTFVDYTPDELLGAVRRCTDLYRGDRKAFTALGKRNMRTDFSWDVSVKKYEALYESVLSE